MRFAETAGYNQRNRPIYLLVGGTIEWNEYVTVRIDGVVQRILNCKLLLKAEPKTPSVLCVYTLTFTYRDKPYSTRSESCFRRQRYGPGDVDALDAILAKGVDDYTAIQ